MAFYTTFIYLVCLVVVLNYNILVKILGIFLIISITSVSILKSPILFDRHYQQTKDQLNFNFSEENFFSNFVFYESIYTTAFNGYLDSKIFGQGARSFRFFCSEKKLSSETISVQNYNFSNLFVNEEITINNVYKKEKDDVGKKEIIFSYIDQNEFKNFYLDHDVKIISSNINKELIGKKTKIKEFKLLFSKKKMGVQHIHITFIYNCYQKQEL